MFRGTKPLYKLNWSPYVQAPFAPEVLITDPLVQTQVAD
jgi:hypothetical protein